MAQITRIDYIVKYINESITQLSSSKQI